MFTPPVCPNTDCPRHHAPSALFFVRKGYYHAKCRAYPIPRFRCRTCERGFSLQTFRADYRDHKPSLNARVFLSLVSGTGIRQSARVFGMARRCLHRKFQKIGHHLRGVNAQLRTDFPAGSSFQMDELGTFEHDRHCGPLTLPIAIEAKSYFIVATASAPIRPSGRKSPTQKAKIARYEARYGRRRDGSRAAVRQVLEAIAVHTARHSQVRLRTDEKPMYVPLAKSVFGAERVVHERFSSKIPRNERNPLFKINLTDAMSRDNNGRLRRRSWLHSKLRVYLDLQMELFLAYRNYVRARTNYEVQSPAECLGFVRRLTADEALSWSQRFGERSVAIPCETRHAVTMFQRRAVQAAAAAAT